MRKHYGYDSYRGRSPLRTFLKATAVVLAVVLLLGVAALYTGLQDFPATDPLTAVAVGIVSGLAATGVNQAIKQMKE